MKITRITPPQPTINLELTEDEYKVIKKILGNISQDFALKNGLLNNSSEYKIMDDIYYTMYKYDGGEN